MATIALLIGGAVVNALAFSGSSFLFSQLKDSNSLEEQQRHNKAVEELQKAQAQWMIDRQERLNMINTRFIEERHAERTFQDVDSAMRAYYEVYGKTFMVEPRPRLEDFYTPRNPNKLILISVVIIGVAMYIKR